MYEVRKTFEISASHCLNLSYDSPCNSIHGHNWLIEVCCRSDELDVNGMVIDFAEIKKRIVGPLDHTDINGVLGVNPTAENIARWAAERIGDKCYEVTVRESRDNKATWRRDNV